MTRGDQTIERLADKLQGAAERAAARGGIGAKLAEPLAEDAAFVRKLKPSLIVARARGEAPSEQPRRESPAVAPSGPQLPPRPKSGGEGPNPFVVVAVALVAGIFLAKLIDWRGHAHPRR